LDEKVERRIAMWQFIGLVLLAHFVGCWLASSIFATVVTPPTHRIRDFQELARRSFFWEWFAVQQMGKVIFCLIIVFPVSLYLKYNASKPRE
jgi:hypothetical protein